MSYYYDFGDGLTKYWRSYPSNGIRILIDETTNSTSSRPNEKFSNQVMTMKKL